MLMYCTNTTPGTRFKKKCRGATTADHSPQATVADTHTRASAIRFAPDAHDPKNAARVPTEGVLIKIRLRPKPTIVGFGPN